MSTSPGQIIHNNQVLTGRELAEYFNEHFVNIPMQDKDSFSFYEDTTQNCIESIFLAPTDEIEICRTFISLKNTRSSDIDNLQIKPIKEVIAYIAPMLAYIFNLAIDVGEFPSDIKKYRVSVFCKGGDKSVPASYQPIPV